jgi:hypothetical protein
MPINEAEVSEAKLADVLTLTKVGIAKQNPLETVK